MQKVEDGKIITFTQTIYSKAHGEWGTFERTIRFPDRLPPVMIEALINKSINDTMNIPRMENLDFEYEDSLNFSVPKAMLSGATEIKKGISSNKIILAGFSQGGAIALHAGKIPVRTSWITCTLNISAHTKKS